MSFSRIQQFSEDVSVHQKLGDNPNTDNGLSSGELKALFDSPAEIIKEFINQRVTPALLELEENADNVAAWRIETSNAINQVRSTAITARQIASQAVLYAESADKRAKDAESLAQQATSTAAEARDSAATAAQDASDARDSASLAQASAESAQSSAEEAKNIANDADEKAQNAEASAQNAMDTAERAVQKSGDTMAGALSMGGNKLTGLPEPEDDADAVNLGKVRSLLASTPGTPGPYYTPSYSDLGNGLIQLSFDKSDSSLPDISPVTIQLPKGKDGDPGDPGKDGVTPNLLIGSVSTLPEGSQASAEITGTKENPVIHIGIPTGATGKPGKDAPVYYGDCPTAANVQAKVATTSATNITFGAILYAKFAYDNITANPTLSAGGMRAPIVGTDLNPIAPFLLTAGLHQLYLLAYPDPEDETHGVTAWVLLTGAASGGSGGTSISIDTTLTQSGQAADAKATGDMIKQTRDKLTSGKEALAGTNLTLQDPEDGDRGVRFDVDPKISDKTGAPIAQRLSIYGIYGDEPVRLGNIYDPAGPQDAATKGYVDATIATILAGSGTGSGGVDVLADDTLQEAAAYIFQGPGAADTYRKIVIEIACPAQSADINTGNAAIFDNGIAIYFANVCGTSNMKTTINLDILNSETAVFNRSSINTASADPMYPKTYKSVSSQLVMSSCIDTTKPLLKIPAELPAGTRIRITGVAR